MAQQDFVLDGSLDAVPYGAELEAGFQALATISSGTSFPTVSYPYQLVMRTDLNCIYQRAASSATWEPLYSPGQTFVKPSLNDFRLSVTSSVPYGASSSAATTIFWTQATGNQVSLWSVAANAWLQHSLPEQTISLTGRASGFVYDIFVFATAQNTVSFEVLAWTSFSARATSLARQNGVWVKAGSPERRYIGSFVTTGTGQTQVDSLVQGLYNADNQADRICNRQIAGWSATTNTNSVWSSITAESRVWHLIGLPGHSLAANCHLVPIRAVPTASVPAQDCRVAFSLGSTSAADGRSSVSYVAPEVVGGPSPSYAPQSISLFATDLPVGYSDVRLLHQSLTNGAAGSIKPSFVGGVYQPITVVVRG